ncbi:hypothetical protein QCA50_000933 [Cerrena zonata]|uniref:Up-regulated during septation protein 1 domain-containing protein n=1 Tax=Cerrena zonata TaxID=2478898 RepID=A0AAW0H0L5_9APHY
MNGVRRFLGGGVGGGSGTSTPTSQDSPLPATPPVTAPLFIAKPSWPPSSPPGSPPESSPPPMTSPKTTTAALFFRRDKQKPPPSNGVSEDDNTSFTFSPRNSNGIKSTPSTPSRSNTSLPQASSPGAGPSSPTRPAMPQRVSQLSRKSIERVVPAGLDLSKRLSGTTNMRDELLITLLASDAIVDSRGYEILSAEEVEELKKEHTVLSSRLVAMNKKLQLETKIRDAAVSLSKANASYKNVSKQSSEQLDNANRRWKLRKRNSGRSRNGRTKYNVNSWNIELVSSAIRYEVWR